VISYFIGLQDRADVLVVRAAHYEARSVRSLSDRALGVAVHANAVACTTTDTLALTDSNVVAQWPFYRSGQLAADNLVLAHTAEVAATKVVYSTLTLILRRFRRVWQSQNQRLIHRLRWQHPGTVWAADHVQPNRPIDGNYPYALSVRDLPSQYQLAWQPVPDVGGESTLAVLASLFWEHGPRLVLKSGQRIGIHRRRDWQPACRMGYTAPS
jgi:hypothetical protein